MFTCLCSSFSITETEKYIIIIIIIIVIIELLVVVAVVAIVGKIPYLILNYINALFLYK
jgi:hypothetical protein